MLDTSKLIVSTLIRFCVCSSNFNVPPTRLTVQLEMSQMKILIKMERLPLSKLLLLSKWFKKSACIKIVSENWYLFSQLYTQRILHLLLFQYHKSPFLFQE